MGLHILDEKNYAAAIRAGEVKDPDLTSQDITRCCGFRASLLRAQQVPNAQNIYKAGFDLLNILIKCKARFTQPEWEESFKQLGRIAKFAMQAPGADKDAEVQAFAGYVTVLMCTEVSCNDKPHYIRAWKWFNQAAALGHEEAQENITLMRKNLGSYLFPNLPQPG